MSSIVSPDDIRPGEFADAMPDMDAENYEALKQSIRDRGLDYPILVDESGIVVDGHHRLRACRELGIEPQVEVVGAEPERAWRTNLAQRDLSNGTKREAVKRYLERHWDGDRSLREIAGDIGVSHGTVKNAKDDLKEAGKLDKVLQLSTEEKRERVREYIDANTDASNRDVADAMDFEVSHVSVGKWRPDRDTADDASDNGDGDGDADDAFPTTDTIDLVGTMREETATNGGSDEAAAEVPRSTADVDDVDGDGDTAAAEPVVGATGSLHGPGGSDIADRDMHDMLDYLSVLPPGQFTWSKTRIPDDIPVRSLRSNDIVEIETTARVYYGDTGESYHDLRLYRVTDRAADLLAEADRFTPCPCGHAGLRNRGDRFECGFDLCDLEFKQSDLEGDYA